MIGKTLGDYRIVEQIGAGGMATVYKAYEPGMDRFVALKVLPEHFSKDPTFRQRFEREAKAIAHLEHIHILPIFTYGEDAGVAYLVMRFIEAGTLADRIGQGPLPFEECGRILEQIASALDHAHKNGIIHRDIKPSNVLIDGYGNTFLTDFGIARMVAGSSELTGSGLIGTPYYMSPEQCQGEKNLTPASDQYSLGIVLFEMLSGSKPYQAETPVAVIMMHLNDPLPSPRSLCPGMTEDMEKVLFKALAKHPNQRYPTCSAMASAFAAALATRPVAAAPPVEEAAQTADSQKTAYILDEDADQLTVPMSRPAPARQKRGLPAWATGLIGVLVVGAVIGGLALTGQLNRLLTLVGLRAEQVVEPCEPLGACISVPGSSDEPKKLETTVRVMSAAWGPDGQILISGLEPGRDPTHDIGLYIMNADGSDLHRLPVINNNVGAVWSPNGELIAMHSSGMLGVVSPDASGYRSLWAEENRCAQMPQWSPDSQRIVFTSDWCDPPNHAENVRRVMVVWLDKKSATVVKIDRGSSCHDAPVAFSPDGTQVAYIDELCRPALINADGPSTPQRMDAFPQNWTGSYRPQWGE